ncbi:MAG: hypothetical protein RL033_2335 [Pseudomonadota bacterium]
MLALPDGRAVGLLRGSAELRLFARDLALLDRVAGPRRGSALALQGSHGLFVTSELDARIRRYQVQEGLSAQGEIAVPGVHSLRALASSADVLFAASEESSALFAVLRASSSTPEVRRVAELGRGVQRLQVSGSYLVASCLLDHTLVVLELAATGLPSGRVWRARHDGPFWGFAALATPERLVIAASGVEDHPLDRRIGSFGYVDSFLYLYELRQGGALERRLSLNASERGVLTARALSLRARGSGFQLSAEGFGSARTLELELDAGLQPTSEEQRTSLPGSADLARLGGGETLSAHPLLDAFRLQNPRTEEERVLPVASRDARTPLEKLGEALELTNLMAPAQRADGPLSRFTCETCHFEGGIDGRIHHTGRGDVVATTKPLRGLSNNRPYFSRALDPDLTQMVHNEFRAASAGSGSDPWFALRLADHAWLSWLGLSEAELSPLELRRALLQHFLLVEHPPNPRALERHAWTEPERQGAELFRERCEGCHQARLLADELRSRVPFERWQELIFSEAGPLIWGRDGYEKTGIEPLVHPLGARVPSLRRVVAKYPLFTNGSAGSLEEVLAAACWSKSGFAHRAREGEQAEHLSAAEREALLAFSSLL